MFFRLSSIVLLTALTLLEYGATTPYLLQKMFVRFCQPFLVSAIILAFYMVIESPLYIALFFISVAAAILYLNRHSVLKRLFPPRVSVAVVVPLPSSPVVTTPDDDHTGILQRSSNREAASDEEFSISFSISSESSLVASLQEEEEGSSFSAPSPLNTSEEGSFYNSIPDSDEESIRSSESCHNVIILSPDNNESCRSVESDNSDHSSIHSSLLSNYFEGY